MKGVFSSEILWSFEATKDSFIWWKGLMNDAPVLAALATKLMQIPASSAAAERNWSHFGFIHSLRRNKLTNERVFKLVSIYSNLHLINDRNKQNNNNIRNIENYEDDIDNI